MNDVTTALSDFVSQPFGAVGAICIMAAVTAINSRRLKARIGDRTLAPGLVFNGLNLVGGSCLLVNAVLRDEIVWLVLEIYFVVVALKGLNQLRRTGEEQPAVGAPTTPEQAEPVLVELS